MYKIICVLFSGLILYGCNDFTNHDQKSLENLFPYYFQKLNSGKKLSNEKLHKKQEELEDIYNILKYQESEHKEDFRQLLYLYMAASVIRDANNPKFTKAYLRSKMHPATNNEFAAYQRAFPPRFFEPKKHMSLLKEVFETQKDDELFGDFIREWQHHKNRSNNDALINLSKGLEKGLCRGLAEQANRLMCENPAFSAQEIINGINNNFKQTLISQVRHRIIGKLNKYEFQKAHDFIKNENDAAAVLHGFKLRSDVKSFIGNLLEKAIREKKNFYARASFMGQKIGHAIAIQVIEGKEFRIIDNNVGALVFNTPEEFLDAFARYRFAYYYRQHNPVLVVVADYCS
jgi:hypothetical protein